ncbi:MAG: ATP-binding cassette domain-containing protein, partial [Candidatus Gastranaerophilales bacterium]|nr:ATP-binding cassette domain-containing protein [Candidatus Gastranaerophilales bacterium]
PHMNVYDNMAFGLKMRKFSKDEIDKRVKNAANILDLADYLQRKPKQLSGGQRQRVALGRAIVRDPAVFLMDEPLSNLDAKLRIQMRSEIKKLHKKLQTTFVYVTHDQVEALTMGDKIVILNNGIIQQVDTPDNIYNYPQNTFVAGFIGSPAMGFVDAKVIYKNEIEFLKHTIKLSENLIETVKKNNLLGQDVILGIRPEYFSFESGKMTTIKVVPELVEMLGSEKIVHFNSLCAKLPSDKNVAVNKEISLELDISKCVFFDKNTQKRFY